MESLVNLNSPFLCSIPKHKRNKVILRSLLLLMDDEGLYQLQGLKPKHIYQFSLDLMKNPIPSYLLEGLGFSLNYLSPLSDYPFINPMTSVDLIVIAYKYGYEMGKDRFKDWVIRFFTEQPDPYYQEGCKGRKYKKKKVMLRMVSIEESIRKEFL